jgi:hypothetical protein
LYHCFALLFYFSWVKLVLMDAQTNAICSGCAAAKETREGRFACSFEISFLAATTMSLSLMDQCTYLWQANIYTRTGGRSLL